MRGISHVAGGMALAAGGLVATESFLFAIGSVIGSKTPDFLELPRKGFNGARVGLLPHRTFTHWPIPWLLGLSWALWFAEAPLQALLMGLFLGGLIHLLQDMSTPMGIPTLNPVGRRVSLRLVRGLPSEIIINSLLLPIFFIAGFAATKFVLT